MIHAALFEEQYNLIIEKMQAIASMPIHSRNDGEPLIGRNFEGIEVDNFGIHYKSSTTYSGCGSEYYTFSLPLEELNNDLDYFEEKFNLIYTKREKQKTEQEQKEKENKELRERKLLTELQSKYNTK